MFKVRSTCIKRSCFYSDGQDMESWTKSRCLSKVSCMSVVLRYMICVWALSLVFDGNHCFVPLTKKEKKKDHQFQKLA